MRVELISEAGNFYKVNFHAHTNLSDGKMTPEELKKAYKEKGYGAVCFTDHEVLVGHKDLCDEEFIALHGYEVAIKTNQNGHSGFLLPVYHFNFVAKDQNNLEMPMFFKENPFAPGKTSQTAEKYAQYTDTIDEVKYDVEWINGYLAEVKKRGFLIAYNHPQWSLQNVNDYIGLENLHAIEVINGGCALRLGDNTSIHFEQLLRAGKRVVAVAGDDNHGYDDVFIGWTMVKAKELSYDALISAYEKGDCYATSGPEIYSLVYEDEKVRIKTSGARSILFRGEGRHSQVVQSENSELTEAEFIVDRKKVGRFFRIEVRDTEGNVAYSNAYYVEDLIN